MSTHTIAQVAEQTGLSRDTLRWYERQGLLPPVNRSVSGYRAYDDAAVRTIQLVQRLRRTGMPLKDIQTFISLVRRGATTHPARLTLLQDHRDRVLTQLDQVRADLAAIDAKIDHYAALVAAGGDCAGSPDAAPIRAGSPDAELIRGGSPDALPDTTTATNSRSRS